MFSTPLVKNFQFQNKVGQTEKAKGAWTVDDLRLPKGPLFASESLDADKIVVSSKLTCLLFASLIRD